MRKSPFVLAAVLVTADASAEALARHVCANGLEVVVAERHATPLVTLEVAVHTGAMTEPPEYSGLSHLFEHMFFKANRTMPDQVAYMARRRELGISGDATTDVDRVNYFDTTTPEHFEGAMAFMHDAITAPLFDPKELERERVVVTGEIDRNESTPGYHLWHETTRRLFAKDPTRKDPLGSRRTVLAATPPMMRIIQQRWYVPNNSVLVVVGDVKTDDVFRQADALYADWKRTADPFLAHPVPEPPPLTRSEVVLVQQPVQTFEAEIEWLGPSTIGPTREDGHVAEVLGGITGDAASRFQRDLVESGSCVRASFTWVRDRHVGPIVADVEASEPNADVCVRALLAELPEMRKPGYFGDDDLRDSVRRAEIQLAHERERTSEYAHLVTRFWAGEGLDEYAAYGDEMRKVTVADLARYLDRYVVGKPFVLGAMASPKLIAAGLDRKHLEALAGIGSVAR